MKRSLIIFALLLFAITASAQSYSSPGIPAGTTSLTPTFRTKAATPDSLAQIWLSIGGNKFYRMLSGMDVIVFDAKVVQGLGTTSSKLTFRDTLLKPNWVINPADTLHPVLTLIQKKSQDNLWLKGTGITDGRATIRFTTEKDTGDYEYGFLAGGDNNLYGLRNVRAATPPNISWVWSVNAHNSDYTNFYRHVGMTGLTDTSTAAKILAIDANGKLFKVPYSGGGTTPNPFTAATSGGASPGTTFDGSVARTFDYSSFGAAPAFTATGSGVILSSGNLGLGGSTTSSRTINFNTHFLEFTGTDFGGTTGTTIFQGNGFSSNITNAGGDHYGINISTAQAQLNGNNGSGNVGSVNASSNHADLVFTDGSGINSISSTDNGIHIGSTIDFKAAYYDDVYLLPTGNYIPSKRQVDSIAIAKADSISGGGGGGANIYNTDGTLTDNRTLYTGGKVLNIFALNHFGGTTVSVDSLLGVRLTTDDFADNGLGGNMVLDTSQVHLWRAGAGGHQGFKMSVSGFIVENHIDSTFNYEGDYSAKLRRYDLAIPNWGMVKSRIDSAISGTTVHTSNGLSGDGSVGTPVVLGGTFSGNIDEDVGANSIDWHGDNGTYAVDNLIDNTPGGSLISSQASNSAGSHYAAVNIGITSPTGWYAELATNKSGSGASIQLDGNTGNTTITNTLGSFGAQYGADYSTALRLNPNGIASVKVVKDMADSVKGTISGGITALTGDVTASGSGSVAATVTNSAVIGKVLTGYTSGSGTIASTDNILQAIQKLNGNDALRLTNPLTTTGDIIYSSSGSTPARLAIGGANTVLHGGTTPSYSAIVNGDITNGTIDLTTKVTGLLPNANLANSSTTINGTSIALGASGTVTAAAGTLTGTTLNSTVVTSSLTSVGTLSSGSIPYSLVTGGPSALTAGRGILLPSTAIILDTTQNYNWLKAQTITKNALGTTQTEGFRLQNTTAAALGAVQISPYDSWLGNNWATGSSASIQFGFRAYTLPIQNSSGYNGEWHLQGLTALNTWADALKVDNGGTLTAVNFVSNGGEVNSGTFRNASSNSAIFLQTARTFNASGNIITFNPGSITNSSGLVIGLNATQTINQTSTASYTYNQVNLTETAVGSGGAKFVDYQVAGTSKYSVKDDGTINSAVLTASTPLQTDASKNIISSPVGQTTLVAGTKAITITGLTTSSKAFCQLVSQGGTVTTTQVYGAVCTTNTLTITALTTAGATDTTDTSVLNYFVVVQ